MRDKFDGHNTISDLQTGNNPQDIGENLNYGAITGLVMRHEDLQLGVLVAFQDEDVSVKTIAHESVHVADAMFDWCGIYSQGFDESNEAYAYLVGWAAECIDDYLTEYKKMNKK